MFPGSVAMESGRVSIIIPSRNEKFLAATCRDLLAKAAGDVEVIAVLDGYWDHTLPDDKRLKILHRGQGQGMRQGINSAAQMATGEYLLKSDAHCMFSEGYDEILKADCQPDSVIVPRRMSLDPHNWCEKATGKSPVDAHYLSWPYEEGRPGAGLHGTVWNDRARRRKDVLVDEEMSSQGSCWFMPKAFWPRIGPLDVANYGSFINEFQEVGLKAWLGGGSVLVTKRATYWHWHKGKEGRGYFISKGEMHRGSIYAIDYWMHDRWPERKHNLRWLIERFAPVPSWPADLDEAFRPRRWTGETWELLTVAA